MQPVPASAGEPRLTVAHTSDLDPPTLAAARALLDGVFGAELTDDDWEHALGGVHALMWEDGRLVGHASVVQRRLLHGERALRTGYVEGVAVRPDRRRRGHGAAMMEALERVIRAAYDLGALGATDEAIPFYTTRGWQPLARPKLRPSADRHHPHPRRRRRHLRPSDHHAARHHRRPHTRLPQRQPLVKARPRSHHAPTKPTRLAENEKSPKGRAFHSHSIVPGGLLVMSSTTRLTSRSSPIMREAMRSSRS
jgi:aminoglycoside 2'-N-acetyltransferase I